jgi:hypothetical protein
MATTDRIKQHRYDPASSFNLNGIVRSHLPGAQTPCCVLESVPALRPFPPPDTADGAPPVGAGASRPSRPAPATFTFAKG